MDEKVKPEALVKLVEEIIAADPHEYVGHLWAAREQEWYCQHLGISPATLKRWIAKPPFDKRRRHVDGKPLALLRVGPPVEKTHEDYARIMGSIFYKRLGRRISRGEFGMLTGLSKDWPPGRAPEIFAYALDNWSDVAVAIKIEIEELPAGFFRHWKKPSIGPMRRFHNGVLNAWVMHQQSINGDKALKAGLHKFYDTPNSYAPSA